ncbi:hypothetical protein EVAR_50267_1 [Eumeta japonica]|uniref:Uncharacterized protein n=1 Tax=Eumeta variegata TaxID=151549 RepID=A0A4C1Y9R8_EUMVA|nr:hypothetical protein EVAR_50267_1 [Eumeta japonica]
MQEGVQSAKKVNCYRILVSTKQRNDDRTVRIDVQRPFSYSTLAIKYEILRIDTMRLSMTSPGKDALVKSVPSWPTEGITSGTDSSSKTRVPPYIVGYTLFRVTPSGMMT